MIYIAAGAWNHALAVFTNKSYPKKETKKEKPNCLQRLYSEASVRTT